jgi:hypothetical protein
MMTDRLLEAYLASCVELPDGQTPIIGQPEEVTGPGMECTRWYLYADSAMTKSIGVIELSYKHWKPQALSTTNT